MPSRLTMIEIVISHDGRDWMASLDHETSVSAPSLDLLDDRLRTMLQTRGIRGQVRMLFDHRVFPPALRQYSSHYFNRIIDIS